MGYKDVPDDYIYQKAIRFTQVQGLMSGVDTEGNFAPKGKIKLSELCVLIAHLFDFDYDSYRIENSSEVPEWVFPYFMACLSYKVMPDSFENRIVLDEYATIDDLYLIFSLAQKYLISLEFKTQFDIPEKASNSDLTREICAYLIYRFCHCVSKIVFLTLKDPKNKCTPQALLVFCKYKWSDYFYNLDDFDLDLQQIYYTFSQFSSCHSYVEALNTMLHICQIRNSYFLCTPTPVVYHYTSLNVLEILTRPGATFHISNIVYLNDPQEGLDASNLLLALPVEKKLQPFISMFKHSTFELSSCFIGSFMQTDESLPMWVQYACHGAGCCLCINLEHLKERVYKVTYNKRTIKDFFKDIFHILIKYAESSSSISFDSDPVYQYAKLVLQQSCYLYKNSAYSHEQEFRIIRFLPLKKAKAEEKPRKGEVFPRVYCELPIAQHSTSKDGLIISSVTLGPTVSKPEHTIVALVHRGFDPKQIIKSKIKFRT